ncbi:phosphatase PAP2 family protein [Parahaliea maris]|uniref:undecaprenyl-diphosphate phosphatase n=1 Tax=Parahaliea maris TaxID=2716870 RepID=A0A5C8ZQJ5_9GAMM|nr:phosphatase PAP2 family protein [Parahaliea maris]TXS90766.1 phosphatase PAP2 family protein [Parahaliea maris]
MLDLMLEFDQHLLFLVNNTLSNPVFDLVMPWWRSRLFWIPAYAILMLAWIWRFRQRAWPFLLLLIVCVGLSDFTSSQLIKPWVGRPRPCHEPALAESLRLLVTCGPSFSFTSSHAANHFCFAWLVGIAFKRPGWWLMPSLLVWAASIALGQVYVGVHYPLDTLAGAALGLAIGWLGCRVFRALGYRYPM